MAPRHVAQSDSFGARLLHAAARHRPRGRHRRGGPDAHRPGARHKGVFSDCTPTSCSARPTPRSSARRHRSRLSRRRDHGLRAAVRRADAERRPHRLAAGRAADRDARHDRRRQCGSAQLAVNFAAALIASGVQTSSSAPASSTWATSRWASASMIDAVRLPLAAGAPGPYNLVRQGIGAEMIAEKWEIPRSELDELALRSHSSPHRRPRRAASSARSSRSRRPTAKFLPDQGIRPGTSLEALAGLSPPSRRTARSRRATPRRSPTAPPRCC